MTRRDIEIADMQCWVLRRAQQEWNLSPERCAELFEKYKLLEYIASCYELLHTGGYRRAVDDLEEILRDKGVKL